MARMPLVELTSLKLAQSMPMGLTLLTRSTQRMPLAQSTLLVRLVSPKPLVLPMTPLRLVVSMLLVQALLPKPTQLPSRCPTQPSHRRCR